MVFKPSACTGLPKTAPGRMIASSATTMRIPKSRIFPPPYFGFWSLCQSALESLEIVDAKYSCPLSLATEKATEFEMNIYKAFKPH